MAIGVTFELFGKSGSFVKAAGRAKMAMTGLKNSVTSFASSKAVQFLGGAALVGTFTSLGREAIDLGSKISDLAEQLRIGTEELQTFLAVGLKAGVSQADMEKALRNVTIRTQEALDGNKLYRESIERLGFDIKAFSALDTDKKIIAIAQAYEKAGKSQEAYADVARILGTKAGPKMLEVFRRINDEGFAALTKGAIESGQVMEEHTIASLDAAADAIGRFKLAAQVAVGNIIVNFQTEAGLKSLGIKFTKVVTNFGVFLADAIFEVATFIPKTLGKALIDSAAWFLETLLGPLSQFDFAQKMLDKVTTGAEFLKDVITETRPKAMLQGFNDAADLLIAEYEHAAKIQLTGAEDAAKATTDAAQTAAEESSKTTLESYDEARRKIQLAGEELKADANDAGDGIADGGKQAGVHVKAAASELKTAILGIRTSADFSDHSDESLVELIRRNNKVSEAERNRGQLANLMTAARLDSESANAQRELDFRRDLRRDAGLGVDFARRNFAGDPLAFDKVFSQYVSNDYQTSDAILEESKTTNRLLRGKFKPE